MVAALEWLESLASGVARGDSEAVAAAVLRPVYFMPVVNPDAYALNLAVLASGGGSGAAEARKNRRPDPAVPCSSGTLGVDLNRNYDFSWSYDDAGSSPNPCAEDFRGSAPFSEPETQAVRRVAAAVGARVGVALNLHSYGRLLNIPYAVQHLGNVPPPHDAVYLSLAQSLAGVTGFQYGHPWDGGLYTVNGDASDWMFHTHGVYAMSPELGPRFDTPFNLGMWPEEGTVPNLVAEAMRLFESSRAASGSLTRIVPVPAPQGSDLLFELHSGGVAASVNVLVSVLEGDGVVADASLCGVPGALVTSKQSAGRPAVCSVNLRAMQPSAPVGEVAVGCTLPARSLSSDSGRLRRVAAAAATPPASLTHAVVPSVPPFSVLNVSLPAGACTPGRPSHVFLSDAGGTCTWLQWDCDAAAGQGAFTTVWTGMASCFPCSWLRWHAGLRDSGDLAASWWGSRAAPPAPAPNASTEEAVVDLGGLLPYPGDVAAWQVGLAAAGIVVWVAIARIAAGRLVSHVAAVEAGVAAGSTT